MKPESPAAGDTVCCFLSCLTCYDSFNLAHCTGQVQAQRQQKSEIGMFKPLPQNKNR